MCYGRGPDFHVGESERKKVQSYAVQISSPEFKILRGLKEVAKGGGDKIDLRSLLKE